MSRTTTPDRPIAFAPTDKVALVAGSGSLPVQVAQGLLDGGVALVVLAVRGEADIDAFPGKAERESVELGSVARVIVSLRPRGFTHVVLAGAISRRPKWFEIRPNLSLFKALGRLLLALRSGDDGLLSALVRSIEAEGVQVVGAHQVVPDLLASEGVMGKRAPSPSERRNLEAARAAAKAIGKLDIGQAAVAIGGRAIALEGVEGTDGLLSRVAGLRGHGLLAGKTGGALVKCAKPGQELRADLPTIGPATVDAAHAAGLAGIGVEAGKALVLDRIETARRADGFGMFLVGLPREGDS